jgi:hypothetical protein
VFVSLALAVPGSLLRGHSAPMWQAMVLTVFACAALP